MRKLVQMTVRKPYVVPLSEIVVLCDVDVCDNAYPTGVSYYTDGHGGGGAIQNGEEGGDVDAKPLWSNFEWECES